MEADTSAPPPPPLQLPLESATVAQHENNFSPEIIRPYPKAAARTKKITRKTRKSAILTDTPEKMLWHWNRIKQINLKVDRHPRGERQQKKNQQGTTIKGRKTTKETGKLSVKRKVLHNTDEESVEDDYFRLICCDPFDPKICGEEWIECVICKKWSHVKCVRGNIVQYICLNCESSVQNTASEL
ncbi:hypothetical protein HHI36_013704 [Cryptolaemus montrouzieri]|uniref:Zinc finger PHD-type domain-containing protein n=1 Tax=Cryptolaemus montrouzieri TaxID=559131 RepID=A0ABD2NI56_9CUCU